LNLGSNLSATRWGGSSNRARRPCFFECTFSIVLWSIVSVAGLSATRALAHVASAASVVPPETPDDARVDRLLAQMTLEEKIAVIRGNQEAAATDQGEAGYLAGVPRLGIPSMRFADGPPGILTRIPSAAPTATMGLAATFSREDARQNGVVIGLEAKRLGIDVALEPFINMLRDISFGRGWNTFGEDPLLTGTMGAEEIRGIQGQGVMAQAKHYIGYDMTGFKTIVGAQALHEIYLAPFADAIDAGVSSVMCSYNWINGKFGCGNKALLDDVLRGELGFEGFVTSDWGATHTPLDILTGLDMEMPGLMPPGSPWLTITRSYFDDSHKPAEPLTMSLAVLGAVFDRSMPEEAQPQSAAAGQSATAGTSRSAVMHGQFPDDPAPENMWSALQKGEVDIKAVDRAAFRILHEMNRFGYLDGKTHQPTGMAPDPRIDGIIRKTSTDAAVLLKNEDQALPLKPEDYADLALIGPGGGQVVALGINAEHSLGLLDRQHSAYQLLKDRVGQSGAKISYAVADDMTGTPIPSAAWSYDGTPGLGRFQGERKIVQDAALDFTEKAGTTLPAGSLLTWRGDLEVSVDGIYGIYLQVLGANGNLSIDGKPVSHTSSMIGARHGDTVQPGQDNLLPTADGLDDVRRDVTLSAGKHRVEVTTTDDSSRTSIQVRLAWVTPQAREQNFRQAIELASHANKVVVFAWARQKPLFGLAGDQNALIERISSINPNTIVVLNTSLPVAMPWLDKVKAVLNMWWPGDEGGEAAADILQGRVSPAGRLPFTWARRLQDYPATDPRYPERGQQASGEVTYSEGIDVGYRWFDRQGTAPLYSFGYGLSYTRFEYSHLTVGRADDGGLDVKFAVHNIGRRESDEVPQVYLGAPSTPPEDAGFAVRALAGFERIHLRPGERRTVSIHIAARSLQYWSEQSGGWKTPTSARDIFVGPSSSDLPLRQRVH
jgi:beta-glucosidase